MNDTPECSFDEKLKIVVHRFPLGSTTCRCGEMTAQQKPQKGTPWRHQSQAFGNHHPALK